LGILRGIALLPFAARRRVGSALGILVRHLPLAYVRIARRNIDLCLPQLSAAERDELLDRHCQSLGMGVCETATTWWSSNAEVARLADVQGVEHLHRALAKGRGVIVIGGHFTTIEIATTSAP
jgi:KDO2-lipid IV(A) lauroyltransferase